MNLEDAWGKTAAPEDVAKLLPEIDRTMASVHTYIGELKILATTMEALIKAGEARRLGRVSDIKVGHITFDGRVVVADVSSSSGPGNYLTRITVLPSRGHHCTCMDWQRNGKQIGPCKHVLALGTAFRDDRLVPALDRMATALMGILEHSEV